MGDVGRIRRFYRSKAIEAEARGDIELAMVWRWKQENATPATPLPDTFPLLSRLASLRITTLEDLIGPTPEQSADEEELVTAGLTRTEAAAVIAAIKELST